METNLEIKKPILYGIEYLSNEERHKTILIVENPDKFTRIMIKKDHKFYKKPYQKCLFEAGMRKIECFRENGRLLFGDLPSFLQY